MTTNSGQEHTGEGVAERITDYLTSGGLFNPEHMPHGAARDLLIDCRAALEKLTRERDEAWAEAARLDSIIDDMLPVTADGRHVFIDGTGCVEIDLGRKMRARIAALEAENAALRRDGERLANASDNFCSRFTMNDLAEDDDRQRQAALDQSRLFRAILGEQP